MNLSRMTSVATVEPNTTFTMLQSPKSRGFQRQIRLTATESPIIEAKHDTNRRVQRPIAPDTQRGSPRKQQHRRHLSVPDNVLMSIASASGEGGAHDDYKIYPPNLLTSTGNCVMDMGADRQAQSASTNINNYFLQRKPEPIQVETRSSTQTHFPDFMPEHPDDASKMIDDLFTFETFGQCPPVRRGSAPHNSTFDSLKGSLQRAQTFPRNNSALPTPPQSAHLQCLSTFDLAPLPHSSFINLASLSMPIEGDVESYFSPRSDLASPTFPSVHSSAELGPPMFENTMSTVPEETFSNDSDMIKVPTISEATFDISDIPQHRERGETTPQPIGAKATGISMDEITSFISGPEPSDGKWVCKFPECEKRFGRKENIKSHVQTHLGDRQFQCAVCRKCFVRQHDLKRHSKIHTGIKPYPCLCGNSFARHDALTRHRQRGMCIGAFEGIVKKVAKRGRPRKKPLNEDGSEPTKKTKSPSKGSDQESSSSSSSESSPESDITDRNTPTPLDSVSPPPDTPNGDQYDSSESSAGRSVKEESPELLSYSMDSDYSPPTSPPESYEFDNFTPKTDSCKRYSYSSMSLPDEDFGPHNLDYAGIGLPMPGNESGKCGPGSEYSSDGFSQASGDDFLFSQDGLESMFSLSALERDPSILSLGGEDIYIKPELLSNP